MNELELHEITPTGNNNVINNINEKEFNEFILKLGSFLSIVNSKKINQTQLFLHILENKNLQEVSLHITGIDTLEEFVRELILRYPILYKSKIVKTQLSKNAKRKTKKYI